MQRKSVIHHFDQLCINAAGRPKDFWNSLRLLMHSKRSPRNGYFTLKENNTIIKDQNLVAEAMNNYFTNIVDSLNIHPYTTFESQSHVSNIPKHVHWNHNQFDFIWPGYRKYPFRPTALLSLTEQWKDDLDKHNIIGTIAIDLSKAFDCLPDDLILKKLKLYGLSDHALSLLNAQLSLLSLSKSKAQRCFLHMARRVKTGPTGLYLRTYTI